MHIMQIKEGLLCHVKGYYKPRMKAKGWAPVVTIREGRIGLNKWCKYLEEPKNPTVGWQENKETRTLLKNPNRSHLRRNLQQWLQHALIRGRDLKDKSGWFLELSLHDTSSLSMLWAEICWNKLQKNLTMLNRPILASTTCPFQKSRGAGVKSPWEEHHALTSLNTSLEAVRSNPWEAISFK